MGVKDNMRKKLILALTFLVFVAGICSSQQQGRLMGQKVVQPWWYTLEQGKLHFRNGSYGDALIAFEDARRDRIAQFTRMEQDFVLFLSTPDVRRLGDSLEFVEWYITERRENTIAAILSELYYRIPKDSLNGSVTAALNQLDRLKSYPEAEFWMGETYKAEGELPIALSQYEKAWNDRSLLETPGFDMEILYRITDLQRVRGNYQEMERRAKEIIEGPGPSGAPRDELWTGNRFRSSMARILETEGVSRFLTLFRYNFTDTEKAHRLLGSFYYATSRFAPAMEHLMFAFLIQNTVLIEEVIRRDFDFNFVSLENLMSIVRSRPDLIAFIEETDYYRTIYYFASALNASGRSLPASQLWAFLAGSSDAGEWGDRARRNPIPYIERAVEMP